MPEIIRARDCIVFYKTDAYTVAVSDEMVRGGWSGGQCVQWVDAPSGMDDRIVTYARGLYGGYLVWGSSEQGDDYVSMTRSQPTYQYATIFLGGSLIATSTYERYTYESRAAGGPLIPLVYEMNDHLYFSLRGRWTKQDELSIISDINAPAFFTGFVTQKPKANNNYFLSLQTGI